MFQFKIGEWQALFLFGDEQNLKWWGSEGRQGVGDVDKKEERHKPELVRVRQSVEDFQSEKLPFQNRGKIKIPSEKLDAIALP